MPKTKKIKPEKPAARTRKQSKKYSPKQKYTGKIKPENVKINLIIDDFLKKAGAKEGPAGKEQGKSQQQEQKKQEPKEPSLEKKIEIDNEASAEKLPRKTQEQELLEIILGDQKYKKIQQTTSAETSASKQHQREKSYSSSSYGVSAHNYAANINPSVYGLGASQSIHELEDSFIKEGILTPGRMPTRDQLANMADRLRKIKPGASEENIIFYEKKILEDMKERKDIYVSKLR